MALPSRVQAPSALPAAEDAQAWPLISAPPAPPDSILDLSPSAMATARSLAEVVVEGDSTLTFDYEQNWIAKPAPRPSGRFCDYCQAPTRAPPARPTAARPPARTHTRTRARTLALTPRCERASERVCMQAGGRAGGRASGRAHTFTYVYQHTFIQGFLPWLSRWLGSSVLALILAVAWVSFSHACAHLHFACRCGSTSTAMLTPARHRPGA